MVVAIEQIFRDLSIGMTFALITIKLICSYLFYRKYQSNKENKMVLGFAVLLLLLAIGRIFFVNFDYFLTNFDNSTYQVYSVFWKIASAIQSSGFLFLIFLAEKEIFKTKTKFCFSIGFLVFFIISMVLPDFIWAQLLGGIPTAVAILFIPVSYLYLSLTSEGQIRLKSFSIFVGFLVFAVGFLMLSEAVLNYLVGIIVAPDLYIRYIFHVISVGFKFGGIFLIVNGFLID